MEEEEKSATVPRLKGKTMEQFLGELEENFMIDDHGDALIGERKRKPDFKREEL